LNCKNLKTSAYIIEELLKQHQIILVQEHWLFKAQINTIGDLNKNINFVGKGVDKYNPVLPKSMPRGYGGVAIIWRENIDHLIKILPDGTERIQCVEINSNNDTKFLVASVYLLSKGSHDYVDEFYDCINQLYEIYQKYQGTHKIIIGGDLNEDLNNEKTNKRKKYLFDLIKECGLSYDSSGKTFIKPNGEECSELRLFPTYHQLQVLHKERSAQQYHHKRVRPSSCKNDYNARPRHQKLKRRGKKATFA
jgi:exonuclease III